MFSQNDDYHCHYLFIDCSRVWSEPMPPHFFTSHSNLKPEDVDWLYTSLCGQPEVHFLMRSISKHNFLDNTKKNMDYVPENKMRSLTPKPPTDDCPRTFKSFSRSINTEQKKILRSAIPPSGRSWQWNSFCVRLLW